MSCEFDPKVFAKAQEKVAASEFAEWIDLRNESSLEMEVSGTIDLFFSDSELHDPRAGGAAISAADRARRVGV